MNKQERKMLELAAEPICRDFDTFCRYLQKNEVSVSAITCDLGKKDCFELNKLMFFREKYDSDSQLPKYYAIIQFFSKAVVEFEIFALKPKSKKRLVFVSGKGAPLFEKLSNKAKYLVLFLYFKYLYVYQLKEQRYGNSLTEIFEFLAQIEPDTLLEDWEQNRLVFGREIMEYSSILRILHEMRICDVEFNSPEEEKLMQKTGRKSWVEKLMIKVKRLKTTEVGHFLAKWDAECEVRIRLSVEQEYGGMGLDTCAAPYVKDFVPEEWLLIRSIISREEPAVVKDISYDLKVELGDCSRTIRMGGAHTLEDLHLQIQEAFEFDNDHLYSFIIGYGSQRYEYVSSRVASRYKGTLEVTLSELELAKHSSFTYLFDFGDCWNFEINVLKVYPKAVETPSIVAQKGTLPKQYADWEEDRDQYEDGDDDEM